MAGKTTEKDLFVVNFCNKKIEIVADYSYGSNVNRIKINTIKCDNIKEKEVFNNIDYLDEVISSNEVKEGFRSIVSRLFKEVVFRNDLVNRKDIIPPSDDLEVSFTAQFYYLIYQASLEQIKDDIFFKFGYKDLYAELLYQKFKMSEKLYYEGKEKKYTSTYRNLCKDMYLSSYTELLEFAEEYHDEIYDIEVKIKEVFIDEEKNCVKKEFCKEKRIKKVKTYIDNWFLMNSDYRSVDLLLKGIRKDGVINKNIFVKLIDFLFSIKINLMVVLIPIINFLINYCYSYEYYRVIQNYAFMIIPIYYTGLLIHNFFAFAFGSKNIDIIYVLTRRYYPRLLGGIIAGYAILLLGDEVYSYVLKLDSARIICILVLSWIMTYGYLYSKISNKVQDKNQAVKRTSRVFFTGLCHSYFLIYIFNMFIVSIFLNNLEGIEINNNLLLYQNQFFIKDTLHHAKITIVYPTIAMTIGIFLQLLWEDIEITKPL